MAHERCLPRAPEERRSIVNLRETVSDQKATDATRVAIGLGCRWLGRADILRRVESSSRLGGWSYEVYDCKLATETRCGTLLQLSLYTELAAFTLRKEKSGF
jgi:hypothetical protein